MQMSGKLVSPASKIKRKQKVAKAAAAGVSTAKNAKGFRSDAFEAFHSAASALHDVKAIDKKTMREYDSLCIEEVPVFDKKDVVKIRKDAHVSQNVFAHYLNTSPSTVQKWESGDKKPSGMAAKLLHIVMKHGLDVLA
jgi:putative transcriptional regulator